MALLHFFSDDAYNMSGFNISYKINGCLTDSADIECSGHGQCVEGDCVCDPLFRGEACHLYACPTNCNVDKNQGLCNQEVEKCDCNEEFAGDDCSQIRATGYWSTVYPRHSPAPTGSASQGAAVWRDTLYIIGGETFERGELMTTYDFNGNVWETVHSDEGNLLPEMRYGMSTVMYGDKIFMYGGVVENRGISNELWAFDVSAKIWENITVKVEACNNSRLFACGPLHVAGHTATLVPGYADKQNYQYMIVIFGHSPTYGYLNTVQQFNFGTREWQVLDTKGFVVKGGYGHSAAYDFLTEKVYVYGGIISESESSHILSARLYAYEPTTRIWSALTAAPSARFLHTANFINQGMMFVFGGNTHNDTSQSYGAKCYSSDLLVYDVFCDSWHALSMPAHLQADLARFGHSAVVFETDLYIYGGFNGQLLNDMLRYTPGQCGYYTKQERCTEARPGIKCVWDVQQMRCIPISQVQRSAIFGREQYDYVACPSKSRLTMTSELLHDVSRCQELTDCQSCVSNSFGCTYCGNGICSKERCRESTTHFYDALSHVRLSVKQLAQCAETNLHYVLMSVCDNLHSSQACNANIFCHWEIENSRCRRPLIPQMSVNRTLDEFTQKPACSVLSSCQNCTEKECIWCQNEQRCVDRNAYTASFPYGQCREWTTHPNKCRSSSATNLSMSSSSSTECIYYNSCTQCLDDPACGWCDDGSNTGLGKCLQGGALSPYHGTE